MEVKKILSATLQWLLPLALTVALVWWMFSKVDFADMMAIIAKGCDWWWILLAMLLSVLSHILRAARWQMQLRPVAIDPPFMALCCSIFGCYALNLLLPRLGEVWRCTYVAQRTRRPFTTVFGTMVAERLCDTVTVLLMTVLCFVLARQALLSFMDEYSIGRGIVALLQNPLFWASLAAVGLIGWALLRMLGNTRPVRKMKEWGLQVWQGFAAVGRMPGRGKFLLLTLAIWGCYFIQLYVAFFAFDFTARLCSEASWGYGLLPCLVAFVFGAIGMAIPSNGGLGPWNIAVMFGLAVYGVGEAEGAAFTMVQWSGQTVMLIILGIYTMAWSTKSNFEG